MYSSRSLAAAFVLSCLSLLSTAHPTSEFTERQNVGPVISSNFQDPCIVPSGNSWVAFAGANGNPAGINVQIATSSDFVSWSVAGGYDALPVVGAWAANPPHVWAPDVTQLSTGAYVMYYSASVASSPGKHCIGAATASNLEGPYSPYATPLFCDLASGGAIDPNSFTDPVSGTQWVVYKVDGNSLGHGGACGNSVQPIVPTPIILQQVSAQDGVSIIGAGYEVAVNTGSDASSVEAPALLYTPSSRTYTLFFNSGCFTETSYSVQYATSSGSITGPYYRNPSPLLTTGTLGVYIPGGVDVVKDGSKMIFQGDLNLGWFDNPPQGPRVRGMYASQMGNAGTWSVDLALI